jgi:hypothetical protein
MQITNFEQVFVRELPTINSPKISEVLTSDDAILDIYCAEHAVKAKANSFDRCVRAVSYPSSG